MSPGERKTRGDSRRSQAEFIRKLPVVLKQRRTILIVTEARETEPNYFRGLRANETVSDQFAVTVTSSKGKAPLKTVRKAISDNEKQERRDEAYDEVWCILDVEGPKNRGPIGKAIKLAGENGVSLCLSNPCFEIWLLLHFVKESRAYASGRQVVDRLKKPWKDHCQKPYKKNDDSIYDSVADLTETAIENARWVREKHHGATKNTADCNSSTEIYRLVEYLINPPETGS